MKLLVYYISSNYICSGCKSNIRYGTLIVQQFASNILKHWNCLTTDELRIIKTTNNLIGYENLRKHDQEKIQSFLDYALTQNDQKKCWDSESETKSNEFEFESESVKSESVKSESGYSKLINNRTKHHFIGSPKVPSKRSRFFRFHL